MWVELILSFLAGLLLGGFFFGGLWWTVNRLEKAKKPGLLALASFTARTAALLGAMFLLLDEGAGWPRLAAALAGFLAVRVVMVLKMRPKAPAVMKSSGGTENDD